MPDKKGFTLIEIIVAVAIVGILAAIAYPSYQDSVRKSRRADAKGVLLEAAQWMERFFTENNRYDQDKAGNAVVLSAAVQKSPKEGTTKYYNVSLKSDCSTASATVTANTFTLYACRIATSPQASDKCCTLSLTNTGAKSISGAATGVTVDDCWR